MIFTQGLPGELFFWRASFSGILRLITAAQEETIKVGVLHSLSGTMAISETTLKDTMLMLIEQQNAKGGVLGKKLEAVVVDPASDWPLFAEKARELMTVQNVDVMFGCWTSVSRKSVLPVIEELNGFCSTRSSTRVKNLQERVLHRCRAEPAGDPGDRLLP
jgi:ABC-type branched-subunit amino acid transport system substrate-binding protein